jgi:hypothetical protein
MPSARSRAPIDDANVDGRGYVAGRKDTTAVVRLGPAFKVLAVNTLDGFDASPVAVGKHIQSVEISEKERTVRGSRASTRVCPS